MKKINKRLIISFMVIAVIISSAIPVFSATKSQISSLFSASSYENKVSNENLEIAINKDNGRFTIGTTGGNPNVSTDDYKKLLYGHPSPSTSYTTIRLDDRDYTFSTNNTEILADQKKIKAKSLIGQVYIEQELSIINNPYTGRADTVQMKYTIQNADTTTHRVGTRIMMDTMLGNNDGAPFRVPGFGNVTKELEVSGAQIPEYWQAFDNLNSPSIVSVGTLYRNLMERPDKVQFAYWGNIYDTKWDYQISPDRSLTSDSAVAMYWNPVEIGPGRTKEFVSYYGLGSFALEDLRPPLAVRIQAPQELMVGENEAGYTPNPFTVTAYVWNTGTGVARNSHVQLELPSGLSLVNGETDATLGDIQPGQEKTVTWKVQAEAEADERKVNYNVKVTADDTEDKNLSVPITLPSALTGKAGIEYEQITNVRDMLIRPAINSVKVEAIDAQAGRYHLTIERFKCDASATPFFYWKSSQGVFLNVSSDAKSVDFITNPGTAGTNISIKAYIGDNLGYTGFQLVRLPGRP